jgi:hypothetical protein
MFIDSIPLCRTSYQGIDYRVGKLEWISKQEKTPEAFDFQGFCAVILNLGVWWS